MNKKHIDVQIIKSKLMNFDSPDRLKIKHDLFRNSAVLFPFMEIDNSLNVILIKRTNVGKRHRKEMSFPGGKFDSNLDNSLQDTALRETEEEIGVSKEYIKIFGCLDDLPTTTRYIITPFVGLIQSGAQLKKQDTEVEEIYQIPMDFFSNQQNFTETYFEMGSKKFPIYRYPKYNVWGATAHLIVSFIEKVYGVSLSKSGLKRLNVEQLAAIELPK